VFALARPGVVVRADENQPLLLLFPHQLDSTDDYKALGELRQVLRGRGTFQVVTYDPAAPLIARAARDGNHPEWASGVDLDDTQRAALAAAIGADAWIDIQSGGRRNPAVVTVRNVGLPPQVKQLTETNEADADAIQAMNLGSPAPPTGIVVQPAPSPAPNAPAAPVTPSAPVALAGPAAQPPAGPTGGIVTGMGASPSQSAVTPGAPSTPPSPAPSAAPVVSTPPELVAPAPAPVPSAPVPLVTTPAPPTPAPANAGAPPITSATPVPLLAPSPSLPPAAAPTPTPAPETVSPPVAVAPTAPVPAAPSAALAPVPTPATDTVPSAITPPAPAPEPGPQDEAALSAVQPLIDRGDHALDQDEVAEAISLYREAVDGDPRSAVPRLRLAKAYLQGGFQDRAVDEAKRALDMSPNDVSVQEFLIQLDSQEGTATGAVTLYEDLVTKNPSDAGAHLGLGDAYWNAGDLVQAEQEYKKGETLSTSEDKRATTRLARLYAAESRYDDVVAALGRMGPAASYPLAVRLIQSRTDALLSQIGSAREQFDAGQISHEQFYDTSKTVSAQAQALGAMVDQITPPTAYHIAYLDRALAVSLVGQEADVFKTFIETSDASQEERAVALEKSAQSEELTAHAAEEKAGLHLTTDDN
jgi:tetratricopeptide (TPR) repeat protein